MGRGVEGIESVLPVSSAAVVLAVPQYEEPTLDGKALLEPSR